MAFALALGACASCRQSEPIAEVLAVPGQLRSPTGERAVELRSSNVGGFLELFSGIGTPPIARDVTGVGWLSADELVVSTSPIYGLPGLYVHDFTGDSMSVLVAPRKRDAAYPDGTDYFKLHGLLRKQRVAVYFHEPDVDSMNVFAVMDTSSLERVSIPDRRGKK